MSINEYNKPLPIQDALTKPYWDHAKSHCLAVQICNECSDIHFPPSPICPACLSDQQSWKVVSGNGKLLTWGRFHRAYWDGFKAEVPYEVCVVKLDEGPLLVSNFFGTAPQDLYSGMPLKAVFEDVTHEISLVRFVKP